MQGSEAGALFETQQIVISQASAATYLRCDGQCYISIVENFITF